MNVCHTCGGKAVYQRVRVDPRSGRIERRASDLFCPEHWWKNEEGKWWK